MPLGTIALVGSPSSGKSTLFNRMVGDHRAAIVEETPGVTRDRLYGKGEWLNRRFSLIDTGGIQLENAPFQAEIRAQAEIAIEESDLIIFVLDGRKGIGNDDRVIATMIKKSGKPYLLAVNKVDNVEQIGDAAEFYKLGMGDPIAISATHGIGVGDLLDKAISMLPEKEEEDFGEAIPFALIGRPNVGKSSLSNALVGENRSIVSNIEGTTRDSIDTPFTRNGRSYISIDTAGLNKRGRIYEAIDKYAALRAMRAIERAEVVLLLIDGSVGLLDQDKHVLEHATEEKKCIIVVVNKWDLAKGKAIDQNKFKEEIRAQMKFLDYAPIIFVSAKTGYNVEDILPLIEKAHEAYNRRIPTNLLNSIVQDAQEMNPAPNFNHARLKIMYASQVKVAPPTIVIFCNEPKSAHFSYTRYLENRFRESFDFDGSPIDIIYRARR